MNEVEAALAGYKVIGAGIAMIGAFGAAIGLGIYLGQYVSAIARNPGAAKELGKVLWIGIGVIEAIAIYALVIAVLGMLVV